MSNWERARERYVNHPGEEPDFGDLRPASDLSFVQKLLMETMTQFGLSVMTDMKKDLHEACDQLRDLYQLNDMDPGHYQEELERQEDLTEKRHDEFYKMRCYLEHVAVNYFTSDVRRDRFLELLNDKYPVDREWFELESDSDDDSLYTDSDFDSAIGTDEDRDSQDSEEEVDRYLDRFYESD